MTDKKTKKLCRDCAKFRTKNCPRNEYRNSKLNYVACMPDDSVCEEFKQKKKSKSSKRKSQAKQLVQLCLDQQPVIFHDQNITPFIRIKQAEANVTLPIRSKAFRAYLANLMWKSEKKAPGTEAIYSTINILEARALFEGKQHHLYNRVAPAADGFWIDLSDKQCRAIKVTKEGWKIVDQPPILFRRYSHQKPLPEPISKGDPWLILDFINIDQEDQDSRLLLLSTIISYYIPNIPHVILVLHGIQGTGKSTLLKLIRRVVDPSVVELLTLPRNEAERVQQLAHHWCSFYDNISFLPPWMSDCLCRAATGGGFSKRVLYTDDDDVIYNFKRCIALNGINIAAQRGDLLDRTLLIGLKNISKDKRRTEEELLTEFEEYRPRILTGFLDTLVKAIQFYPTVNPKELFRMADFTRWGCAIAKALGCTEEDFIRAYDSKVKTQIEEAAHSSPLASVLIHFMEDRLDWEGKPSDLFSELHNHAKDLGISTRQKAWPKAPHVLVRQLNELVPSLKELGLNIVTGLRTGSSRRIRIDCVTSVTTDKKATTGSSDACDASFSISSCLLEEVEDLVRLTDETREKCISCNKFGKMSWQLTKKDGSWGHLCSPCGEELQKRIGHGKIDNYLSARNKREEIIFE